MLPPRDSSDPRRRSGIRDAVLYGVVVGFAVFVVLLVALGTFWAAAFLLGAIAGAVAAMFFVWSATEGFARLSDTAAKQIAARTGRGASGDGRHLGAGDPGGIDPGMPVAGDPAPDNDARAAAQAFAAAPDAADGVDSTDSVVRPSVASTGAPEDAAASSSMPPLAAGGDDDRSRLSSDHAGGGDPGGADTAMPDPDATETAERAEDAAEAFADTVRENGLEPDDTVAPTTADADVEATRPELLDTPQGDGGDDLKLIRGIGPKLESMLHDLGVWHFRQIASWGSGEVAWVDSHLEGFNGRVARDEWVDQARALAAGGAAPDADRAGTDI